ncbi:hypothetical protein A0H81_08505 [Grifola frondosa]|uniref:Uncharacterized protein n=1 Tax=Grifola frondosa TaxID=5627 RepID=A0A1C7M4X4_GRIFR|nr:hypothetical protein A0H81_08505 [Grifola frondosa]
MQHVESFRIHDIDDAEGCPSESAIVNACKDLIPVLKALGDHGHLKKFEWSGDGYFRENPRRLPHVWEALAANASTLELLDVSFFQSDVDSLHTISSTAYRALSTLRLDLFTGHGWNASRLHEMLFSLRHLTSLALVLPMCCGPTGLSLSYTLPNLQSFALRSSGLPECVEGDIVPPTSLFLSRHPSIKSLFLETDDDFDVKDSTVPNLQALSLFYCGDSTFTNLVGSGAVLRPITHLRLSGYRMYSVHPTNIQIFSPTLHCLELGRTISEFREFTVPFLKDLSGLIPGLRELGILAGSGLSSPVPKPLSADDMISLLAAINPRDFPELRALRFSDRNGQLLPPEFLADLPPVPPNLEYICWDVDYKEHFYKIARFGDRPYKDIDIPSKGVLDISRTLQANPAFLQQIESFRIHDNIDEVGALSEDMVVSACKNMIPILKALGDQGRLKKFEWTGDGYSGKASRRLPQVWEALGANSSTLELLDVSFSKGDEDSLQTLCSTVYSSLRTLQLDLFSGYGWDGSRLHSMIHSLHHLTSLALILPMCSTCGLTSLSLSYTLPNLRSFALSSSGLPGRLDEEMLPPTSQFLSRHPSIMSLSLDTDDDFVIGDTTLPTLRALSFHDCGDKTFAGLVGPRAVARPLAHLRLSGQYPRPQDIQKFSPTLRCLEFGQIVSDFREFAVPFLKEISGLLPGLRELGFSAESGWEDPPPKPLSADDLVTLLATIDPRDFPELRALHLSDMDGRPLPAEFLADFPPVPPKLEYICWDVDQKEHFYKIERFGDKIGAVECNPPRRRTGRRVWTDESVIDHLSP